MIHQLFSIFDTKSGAFQAPFIHTNEGTALRAVAASVNQQNGDMLSTNTEDFELYYLGTFNDNEGTYKTDQPKSIGNIKILLAPKDISS